MHYLDSSILEICCMITLLLIIDLKGTMTVLSRSPEAEKEP